MPSITEDYDDYEDAFSEDYDDYEEASRPSVRTVRTARPASVMARPTDRPVTQAQLQMVVSQFNGRIGQNSSAIQRVNSSVSGLGRDVRRQAVAVRSARNDIGQLRDLTLILPLLQGAIGQENQQLAVLLPFLLAGGIGNDGRNSGYGLLGGGGGGGGGNSLVFLLLLITLLNNNDTNNTNNPPAISGGTVHPSATAAR